MRIANVNTEGAFAPPEPPASVQSDQVSLESWPVDFFLYPDNDMDLMLVAMGHAEASARAEAAGFDAVFLNTVGDYGLHEARSAVRIPVIGAGEAAMMQAITLGERFSIVTIWPESLRSLYELRLEDYGMQDRCASIRFVTSNDELLTLTEEDSFYHRMQAGKEDMLTRIEQQMRRAIDEDGADVIIFGCTCMSRNAATLASRVEVPVVEPASAGYLAAEAAVRMGVVHSPTTFKPPAQSRRDLLSHLSDVTANLVEDEPAENCEACVSMAEVEELPAAAGQSA